MTTTRETLTVDDVKVGSVFVETWGYDQTNVNCYVVTRMTAASVYLKPCGIDVIDGRVRPNPSVVGEFRTDPHWKTGKPRCRIGGVNKNGEVIKRLKGGWHGEPWLNLTTYSGASLWDGEHTYFDTIIAGYPGH